VSLRVLTVAALGLLLAGCRTASPDAPVLRTPEERFSYSVGAKLGGDLRGSGHAIDRELLVRGLEDGLTGAVTLSNSELAAALREGVEKQRDRREVLRAERAAGAQKEGRAFLAQNRVRPGVVELQSGLQYEVLKEGSGPAPHIEDFVTCHYRGSLLDGAVFDDTATLGRPRTFAVTSVVDGFEQALLRMRTGARWKIYVPAELGYGASGAGSKVPPNSTLIFEVDLLSIAEAPSH